MRNFAAAARLVALAWITLCVAPPHQALALPKPAPVTLTTIAAIHNLSPEEAARAYPIHLKAVITYYDPYLNLPAPPFVMVTDATGSIYVSTPGVTGLPYKPGVLVDVTGDSEPGLFGPDIAHGSMRILGTAPMPPHPPRKTMTRLLTGSDDAQWVEVEGVVNSIYRSSKNVTLKVGLADGELGATTIIEPGTDYDRLIDSTVLIHGLAGTLFNTHRQITGLQLVFPGMSTLKVEQPAPQRPFDTPVTAIASLMNYAPGRIFTHRVHIHGMVTLFWPGRLLCVQDDTAALCAETAETTPVAAGDQADLLGFPHIGAVTPTLTGATYRSVAQHPVAAVRVAAGQAFTGERDAQLVQIEGRVVAHDLASTDPAVVLSSGKFTYSVLLPKSADAQSLLALEEGSLVRVTGICSVEVDPTVFMRHHGYPVTKSFQIKLRSTGDIAVLQRPSWWTAQRTLRVLAVALAITLGILCWGFLLRLRVQEQTRQLAFQATHDSLTGTWNRKAVLDFLHRESVRAAAAGQSIGVVMIDADHFKAVNDTYGHPAGDAVLKELARRVQHTVRTCDLTGRYGGEEFLVILSPGTPEGVHSCSERIRAAIANEPIRVETHELAVTVSLGTSLYNPAHGTETEALAEADKALYQAKKSGRNRVVSADRLNEDPPHPATHPAALRHTVEVAV